ncbi:MAG: antitermination regulator, partial [Clostridium sp.]|nr:antitermination regulator [Clostridium sp.]
MIVAFPKLETAKNIKNVLVRNGYLVQNVCTTGTQAAALADGLSDGLLICSYRLSDMLCTELREYVPPDFELLVVASPGTLQENLGSDFVSLALPLKINELLSTVAMMEENMRQRRKKRRETKRTRSESDEKVI